MVIQKGTVTIIVPLLWESLLDNYEYLNKFGGCQLKKHEYILNCSPIMCRCHMISAETRRRLQEKGVWYTLVDTLERTALPKSKDEEDSLRHELYVTGTESQTKNEEDDLD